MLGVIISNPNVLLGQDVSVTVNTSFNELLRTATAAGSPVIQTFNLRVSYYSPLVVPISISNMNISLYQTTVVYTAGETLDRDFFSFDGQQATFVDKDFSGSLSYDLLFSSLVEWKDQESSSSRNPSTEKPDEFQVYLISTLPANSTSQFFWGSSSIQLRLAVDLSNEKVVERIRNACRTNERLNFVFKIHDYNGLAWILKLNLTGWISPIITVPCN